jgi:hypothetical protein
VSGFEKHDFYEIPSITANARSEVRNGYLKNDLDLIFAVRVLYLSTLMDFMARYVRNGCRVIFEILLYRISISCENRYLQGAIALCLTRPKYLELEPFFLV